MEKLEFSPGSSDAWLRRIRTHVEWNVDTHIVRARGPTSCDHPLAHLGGGLVGEGDRQDLPDADVARGQQVGDAAGQHRRLARAGAGHDQQRRALVQHGLALLRVEAVQQLIGFAVAAGRRDGHIAPKPTAASDIAAAPDDILRWHDG